MMFFAYSLVFNNGRRGLFVARAIYPYRLMQRHTAVVIKRQHAWGTDTDYSLLISIVSAPDDARSAVNPPIAYRST